MNFMTTHDMFKKDLSSNMHTLTDEESEELKKVILEITKDITSLCEKHNIPYMLGGGTALGAVRHKGFIPWDDDVDLNVPRPYIKKLLACIKEEFQGKYYVEAPVYTKGYLSSFIQIHKNGTVFKEYKEQDENHCGIKTDIFVIENTYNNKFLRTLHGLRSEAGLFLLSCYRMHKWREGYRELAGGNKKAERIIKIKGLIGAFVSFLPDGGYKRVQKILSECKDNTSEYVVIPSGRKHFFGELYKREAFLKTKKMPFEDTYLSVSCDYDNYLKKLYGDYMKLPSVEEREHHVLYKIKF
ncbi:MAG: LicD family protein [Eubacterium sp.]|nr:LicD family protein [Eubacterium sp.]